MRRPHKEISRQEDAEVSVEDEISAGEGMEHKNENVFCEFDGKGLCG